MADSVTWLIEDYRRYPRKKSGALGDKVAVETRDTLSGLATAYANADGEVENDFARWVINAGAWESRAASSDEGTLLRPKAVDPANVRPRQKLKAIDPASLVMGTRTGGPKICSELHCCASTLSTVLHRSGVIFRDRPDAVLDRQPVALLGA